ncbi:MAG: 2-succinyl-5-enolpyruvyl-6-hydroxy-3-cyclohexene-1-carboxylic-acid synthase [Phycisphaerae bacterium]|jgi:2-succinyl-5-enolpyruvyl-6-hydroxy-3-cyclohexene-1-carboxylate synthase|nr:2-succinyl-5-enolpyruvyl-6-hydroxy-3-cyclohexene-1-carboxylic-acid synthase [Phycisphaerae bacterium]
MSAADAENLNVLWAGLLLEELARQSRGLPLVIVCPGSRSSPLAIAASRIEEQTEYMVVADERCAGFIALGAAATGREPVIITTSGTAVANLLPAVVEASASGRSMVVITADRPAELQECGANQTIPQRDLFGSFVRWSFDLPCPDESIDWAFVLSTADEARVRGRRPHPGPVHLNMRFREPLAPTAVAFRRPDDARLRAWDADTNRVWRLLPGRAVAAISGDDAQSAGLFAARAGVIVVGAGHGSDGEADSVVELARAIRWPVVADVASGLRGAAHRDVVVPLPDHVWGDDKAAFDALVPDFVLRVGGPLTSKRINTHFACLPTVVVRSGPVRFDETHRAMAELHGDVATLGAFADRIQPSSLLSLALQAGEAATEALGKAIAAPDGAAITEPWVAHELLGTFPAGMPIVLGNSMPIRDADMHYPSRSPDRPIVVNRGASGIDGLVSTAVGVALGGRPAALLLGDLSLLHDLGGLANVRRIGTPLHIVVINNDGGGIFHFLPIASSPSAQGAFERFFGTPHGLGFEHAAAMFGLRHRRVTTIGEARAALAGLGAAKEPHFIECVTDRAVNVGVHQAIRAAVRAAIWASISTATRSRPDASERVP